MSTQWRDAPIYIDYAVSDGGQMAGVSGTMQHKFSLELVAGKPHGALGRSKCGLTAAWFAVDQRYSLLPCGVCFPEAVDTVRLSRGRTSGQRASAPVQGHPGPGAGHNAKLSGEQAAPTYAPGAGPTPVSGSFEPTDIAF